MFFLLRFILLLLIYLLQNYNEIFDDEKDDHKGIIKVFIIIKVLLS